MLAVQDDVVRVLPLVVQKIDSLTTICQSLQVCKPWRSCLADCSSCVTLVLEISDAASLQKAAQAAQWMQSHGHLLSGLSIYCDDQVEGAGQHLAAVGESLIAQSLQLAAAKLNPLHLTHVTKSGLYSSAFLNSLPAANLMLLCFQDLYPSEICTRALTQSLGDFCNVREVFFAGVWEGEKGVFPASCFTGLRQLTNLISLHFDGEGHQWGVGIEQHLPVQLRSIDASDMEGPFGDMRHLTGLTSMTVKGRQLSLTQPPSQLQELAVTTKGRCLLDLSALTGLSCLTICASEGLAPGSSLPDMLPALNLESTPLPPGIQTMLGSVRVMTIEDAPAQPASLWKQLGSLSALQQLSLVYYSLHSAAAAAAAWGLLPSLQMLQVYCHSSEGEEHEPEVEVEERQEGLRAVIDGLASARSLEKLQLSVVGSDLPCGMQIANLTRLKSLKLSGSTAGKQDLLQLTKLCQLTELKLFHVSLEDDVCASLAYGLPQLERLIIDGCPLGDVVILVIARQLKSLRCLCLELRGSVTDASVPYLLQLTQLSSLVLRDTRLSEDGWAQLKAGLPCDPGYI